MKVLMCEMKSVCYNSYSYFAEALGNQFENHGHEVTYFRTADEPFENIEKFVDSTFDAIIDFNSELPRAVMDDDSYFLDHINGPFYDVILDHPLYHHDSLKNTPKNFHILCLDEKHKAYIEAHYPHIKSVNVCHLTGERTVTLPSIDYEKFNERPYDVVFTGSYTDPEHLVLAISKLPEFMQKDVYTIIDLLIANPTKSIEEIVLELSNTPEYDYFNIDFPLHMQTFYLADAYVRSLNRKNIVKALDDCDIDFHVFGGLWDELNLKHAHVHKEIAFNLSFTTMSHGKIALNVMPNFKAGFHDRIFSSQLNGAVCLTDPSTAILNEYKDEENILLYSLNDVNSINYIVKKALANPEKLIKIAQNGESIAQKYHSWANVYEVFNKIISNN